MKNFLNKLNIDFNNFNLCEDDFVNHSDLHGVMHTFRVMFNVLLIGKELNNTQDTKSAFYSAYIHDLSRRHDGHCELHGLYSTIENIDKYKGKFVDVDLDGIKLAVKYHSLTEEVSENNKHYKVVCILKDADALDRVRIDDLDQNFLRFNESKNIIWKSEELFLNNFNKSYNNFGKFLSDNLVF